MAGKKSSKMFKELNYEPIIYILSIIIVSLFIINLLFMIPLTSSIKQKFGEAEELARPANLELTIITTSCTNCFDINSIVNNIKSGNVNITKEETINTGDAQQLISRYNIKKLPTIIVKGELNKTTLNKTLVKSEDAFIFTNQTAPYYDTETNRVKGLVTATILNADNCANCTDINLLINQLKSGNIIINSVINLSESNSSLLINNYGITRLPALILSKDAEEYPLIINNWNVLGTKEADGSYVLRQITPPYKDLATGKIDGLVSLTYVTDSSCIGCYDLNIHNKILNGYGLVIINKTTLDVLTNEGKVFIAKNNITLVPTITLSKESKIYPAFYQVFKQVSRETDDVLVFTSIELMGKYRNLETNEIVEPKQNR